MKLKELKKSVYLVRHYFDTLREVVDDKKKFNMYVKKIYRHLDDIDTILKENQ